MTTTKGFRASARPPSALRTPLFARHSRQITTQKSVFSASGDRSHVTAGDGTTHAEPRRAARLIGSATPSLVGVHRAARYFRSVTGTRRPACELRGRESSKITRKSQTYFHHSRARGRESSSYVDAARGQMDFAIAARRPARHGNVSMISNLRFGGGGSTAGNVLACVRECNEPVRTERKRSKPPKRPFRREMIYPVMYYYP